MALMLLISSAALTQVKAGSYVDSQWVYGMNIKVVVVGTLPFQNKWKITPSILCTSKLLLLEVFHSRISGK